MLQICLQYQIMPPRKQTKSIMLTHASSSLTGRQERSSNLRNPIRDPEQSNKASKQSTLEQKKLAKFQEQIDKAIAHILKKELQQCINIVKQLILENKFMDRHEFKGLGNIENWDGQYCKGCLDWFTKTTKQQPIRNPFDLLSIAFMMGSSWKTIKHTQIIRVYSGIEENLPQMHELLMVKGNIYYNNYQFLKAQEAYMRALEQRKTEKVYEYIAWVKGNAFDLDIEAIQYCDKCLEINPNNVQALFVRAICHQQDDIVFEMLQKLYREYPEYYQLKVSMAYFIKNPTEALKQCDEVLEMDPHYLCAYGQKADIYTQIDKFKTKQILEKALIVNPQSSTIYYYLGRFEQRFNNWQTSLCHFQKCLQLNCYNFNAMREIAKYYNRHQNADQCIHYFTMFAELNPYSEAVYFNLGLLHDRKGNKEISREYYKKAIKLKPNDFYDLEALAESYKLSGLFEQAVVYYEYAYKVRQCPDVCYSLAICYQGLSKFTQAEYWGKLCIDHGGDEKGRVYFFLGNMFLLFMDKPKQALELCLKAASITEVLNTNEVFAIFIGSIGRDRFSTLIEEQEIEIETNYQGVFALLFIGKLYVKLELLQKAANTFEKIRRLTRHYKTRHLIRNELKIFFGDPEEGLCSFSGKQQFNELKIRYKNIFAAIYKEQNFNLMRQE